MGAMASRRARRVGLLTGGGDCPGLNAVIRAASRFGTMVALHPPKVLAVPLARAVGHGRMKKVPLHSDILQSARDMGIGFGD
jgi:hypothetical protein